VETKVNYTLVGIFVFGLGALLIAIVLWIASGGTLQKKYARYLAIVDESVAGLSVSAPVKYNGVDVGKVRDIALDRQSPTKVRVLLDIEQGTPVKVDTVAVLKTQGLTGIAYVELDGGDPNALPLRVVTPERYPVIRTIPSLSVRLENVLTTVLAKLDHTSSTVDSILSDENRKAFSSALANIAVVTQTLAERKESLDTAIVGAARTFDNSARVSAQLGPVVDSIGRGASAVEKMGDAMTSAGTLAGKTVEAVGVDMTRLSAETLPAVHRLLGELDVLSASLRRLSEQTERSPSSLILGRSRVPNGPGETDAGASSR
jgi:phospholipid/cholesterol/gamma-HCH transport system substrate-binding protein